jgi:hypothetical protein
MDPPIRVNQRRAVGREKGFMNMEGWLPSVMTYLCLKALGSGIEMDARPSGSIVSFEPPRMNAKIGLFY